MRTVLIASAVLTMAFAPAPLPRPDRGRADRNRLLGTWVLKQVRYAGASHYPGAGVGNGALYLSEEVTISEREMRVQNPRYKRQPQDVPIEVQGGQHVDFPQGGNLRTRGLYRVQGTTLTIAYPAGPEKPRPTTFDNNQDIVLILERVR
jgi:uncharacterized protein (TIGR03067 family)